MELCSELGALYIDTVNEPWTGFYFDSKLGPEARWTTRCADDHGGQAQAQTGQRQRDLSLRRQPGHGVVVRQAGAHQHRRRHRSQIQGAESQEDWARLAKRARVKGIHSPSAITSARAEAAERLRQHLVGGRLSIGRPAAGELGSGTHGRWTPRDGAAEGRLPVPAMWLDQPGANTREPCPTGRRNRCTRNNGFSRITLATTSRSRLPTTQPA